MIFPIDTSTPKQKLINDLDVILESFEKEQNKRVLLTNYTFKILKLIQDYLDAPKT